MTDCFGALFEPVVWRFLCLCLMAGGLPAGADAAGLVPHRAIYALSRDRADPDIGIVGLKGRMELSYTASCDGWRFEQYLGVIMVHENGSRLEHVGRLTGWETSDGKQYWFSTESYEGGELIEEISGVARMRTADQPGSVRFAKPAPFARKLPAETIFPVAHIGQILHYASIGQNHFRQMVFDGSAVASPFEISTFISTAPAPRMPVPEPLKEAKSWLVGLAYFRHDAITPVPEFEMSANLYDNGIAGDMVYDYGDLAMGLQLEEVELLPNSGCE